MVTEESIFFLSITKGKSFRTDEKIVNSEAFRFHPNIVLVACSVILALPRGIFQRRGNPIKKNACGALFLWYNKGTTE